MDLYCHEVSKKMYRFVMGVIISDNSWFVLAEQDTSFKDWAVRGRRKQKTEDRFGV